MSVVCSSSAGWLLDELHLLDKWYQRGGGLCTTTTSPSHYMSDHERTGVTYRFREDLFLILKPHIKTSTTLTSDTLNDPVKNDPPSVNSTTNRKVIRKKRTRSRSLNSGEVDAMLYHKKISDLILEGSLSLIREGLEKGFLQPLSEEEDKTELVTKLYPKTCGLAELCDMAKCMPLLNMSDLAVHILNNENHFSQGTDFITHITENNSDWPQCIQLLGETYLIPPKSSFLMSDTTRIEPLLQYKKYHIIVIDPPWENKSVKRSKSYNYLSAVEIKQLPVPALAYPDCIVIIWVTNRQKHLRFVKEELFPHWSIKTLAEWHWVKITKSGELVFPLDSDHKKPYEILVLGRLQKDDNSIPREPTCNLTPIPQHKLIVSVPCKLHSHKPPLSEILKEYVKQDAECLELFARNLQPGWTCWGNEVLKFQHIDYFVPLET
ncbi:N(6)-adenine-specific methyltransferase METTL4 [Pelobates fuscus]|uniref:N(6)-adenine-specific methyltransferase METTL4 n=1 Tax=Pelobates fuscus TaxID=191477 RepID=UPI002FE4889B